MQLYSHKSRRKNIPCDVPRQSFQQIEIGGESLATSSSENVLPKSTVDVAGLNSSAVTIRFHRARSGTTKNAGLAPLRKVVMGWVLE